MVAASCARRGDSPLPRRRHLCRCGVAREWISSAAAGLRSRKLSRPVHPPLPAGWGLGRSREIEFPRLPLSRAGIPDASRTGLELFQHLLQLEARAPAATLFGPGAPEA